MYDEAKGMEIPQPEQIMLGLYTSENRYHFPHELVLEDENFESYVKHCIRDSQSKGYHVIRCKIQEATPEEIIHSMRTLLLKVAKLPEPIRENLP